MSRTLCTTLMGVALLVALGTPALAQTTAAPRAIKRVEFDEAVRQAIERNPNVQNAAVAIARAELLLQQSQALLKPTVNASATNLTLDHERSFGDSVIQAQNQTTFAATAAVPIFQPTRRAEVEQARDQIQIATLGVTESRRQIAIATAQSYLAVIAARRQVDVDVRALEAARAHLDYAQRRLEGGAGSRLNQLRAAQQVTGDEARLEGTRLSLRRAQESLGVLLAENEAVDAGGEPSFDVPASISEEDWALARPDLARQAATIKAAERVLNDARKDWLPRASLSFTPQVVTSSSLFAPSRTWQMVVSVSQQVFNPSQRAVNALRQVSLNQTKLGRTIIEIQARAEVRLAQASVESVQRSLTSARLAAQQANEVLQITTSAFELGATTNIEVIDAQRSARDAETTATVVEDLLRRARLDLLVAIGRFPR